MEIHFVIRPIISKSSICYESNSSLGSYFGCRSKDGRFDPEMFKKNSRHENVKMIELKLSQGAKPGHGGMAIIDFLLLLFKSYTYTQG